MRTILLTGGIGSGKSAVASILMEGGVPVYDSDSRAKALYTPWRIRRIEKLLGKKLRLRGGELDRKELARTVFRDEEALKKLEDYIYPALKRDFLKWRSSQTAPLVVMESAVAASRPGFQDLWDAVVLVDAPEELRIRRAALRDGVPAEVIKARMRSQSLPSHADAVIRNDGTPEELRALVMNLMLNL